MITFEWNQESERLEIHADALGLSNLIRELQTLEKTSDGIDHIHLMSEDWGGTGLSNESEKQNENAQFVHHVKIYKWK